MMTAMLIDDAEVGVGWTHLPAVNAKLAPAASACMHGYKGGSFPGWNQDRYFTGNCQIRLVRGSPLSV